MTNLHDNYFIITTIDNRMNLHDNYFVITGRYLYIDVR